MSWRIVSSPLMRLRLPIAGQLAPCGGRRMQPGVKTPRRVLGGKRIEGKEPEFLVGLDQGFHFLFDAAGAEGRPAASACFCNSPQRRPNSALFSTSAGDA